jgi:UDP-2,3-diacylglucosamine hydrolase
VRDPEWQKEFLSQTLQSRKEQIEAIRLRSEKEKSQKSMLIMDVNQLTINQLIKTHRYPKLLIHGHTHRPYQHHIQLDGHTVTRWVLGDWYEQGSYLKCDQFGCKAMHL